MSKKKSQPDLKLGDIEKLTYEAMRYYGLIPPMTLDEVARVEAEFDDIELPASLRDPNEILSRLDNDAVDQPHSTIPVDTINVDAVRNLARAAREGGDISPEVEQRMREDKARIEQQTNDQE